MADTRSFSSYVAENKTEYSYLVRFAIQDVKDAQLDLIETALNKYELKSASSLRKTPIQECPMDFPNAKNTPVYSSDIVLGYPASLEFLKNLLCNALGISQGQVNVYTKDDPRLIEMDLYAERTSPEFKANYKTKLGSDYEETGDQNLYGEKYTTGFLQELAKVSKERQQGKVTNALIPDEKIDHSTLPNGYEDFNAPKNMDQDKLGFFGRIKKPKVAR